MGWGLTTIYNGSEYIFSTLYNSVANIIVPISTFEPRKFNTKEDIEKTGCTMYDFDSKVSNIVEDINKSRDIILTESDNNIITRICRKILFDKIDKFRNIISNIDYQYNLLYLEKIKLVYDYFILNNDLTDNIPNVEISGRTFNNRNKFIDHCNSKLKEVNKIIRFFEDKNLYNNVNDLFDENLTIDEFKQKLRSINHNKYSICKMIYILKNATNTIKKYLDVDIDYLKCENRTMPQKLFDITFGHMVNLSRKGMTYSMAYTFYEMYIDQTIKGEILKSLNNKNSDLDKFCKKFSKAYEIYFNLDLVIQKNINDQLVFHFNANPDKKYIISIGDDDFMNPQFIANKINTLIHTNFSNDMSIDFKKSNNVDSKFCIEFISHNNYSGVDPLKFMFRSNKNFTIDKSSSLLPYIGFKNIDRPSWNHEILDKQTFSVCYSFNTVNAQYLHTLSTNNKNNKLKIINSLLIDFCNILGRTNSLLNDK